MALITLPNIGVVVGFADGDGGWGDDMNAALRLMDALINCRVVDILNTPPGSPTNGSVYIVGTSPTGAFTGYVGRLAIYRAANSGEGVSAGWIMIDPKPGFRAYVIDDKRFYRVGSDFLWVVDTGTDTLVTESGTARTAQPEQADSYVRFTNAGTKTYNFDANLSYAPGNEFTGRNVGAGSLTIAGLNGFTVNPATGGVTAVPQNSTFKLKIVNSSVGDLSIC